MYKELKRTSPNSPMYATLKINFTTYKRILRNSIIDAKKRFYDRYFNMYKSNMNKTW